MRAFIIICVSTLVIAMPQGYLHTFNQQPEISMAELGEEIQPQRNTANSEPTKSIQELPNIKQNQIFSIELPLSKELSSALEQPHQTDQEMKFLRVNGEHMSMPFQTYGVFPPLAQNQQNEVLVSKQFFLHSAPDEEDEETPEKVFTVGLNRKNYNVVFIRAPVKSQKTAVVKLIPAFNEDKTIVYVLSKKTEADNIDARVEEQPTTTNKPEVYFIRYKTPEEAAHAQEKIQTEYERLGGSTHITNEGVSQITSIIGSLEKMSSQNQPIEVNFNSTDVSENLPVEALINPPFSEYLPPHFN